MTYEEMHKAIREAILAYKETTAQYVARVETEWYEIHNVGIGTEGHLKRLTIVTMDMPP